MRRLATSTAAITLTFVLTGTTAAAADPAFGPGAAQGQGNNEPHENPGTKCHPPGQTDELPACK